MTPNKQTTAFRRSAKDHSKSVVDTTNHIISSNLKQKAESAIKNKSMIGLKTPQRSRGNALLKSMYLIFIM